MMKAYYHYLGEYPFKRRISSWFRCRTPALEHQSAVAYGTASERLSERDWTGVGISPRFDFIIIHESGP
jgi:hypothetical protein